MTPTDIGSAYDQITHLWQSDKFNLANGIEAHKRALSFVKAWRFPMKCCTSLSRSTLT